MNYDRIKYFVTAAELHNFSEAARQMYITPQAFGRQIALLEKELGTELFKRTKHNVSLTYEGEIIYRHMAPLVEAMENEYQAMEGLIQKRRGRLNVGMLSFLSRSNCTSPIINEIYSSQSSIDINTQMYEMRELIDATDSGEIDLAVTMMHEGLYHSDDYVAIPLMNFQAKLVVSLYHKWVMKENVTLEDMAQMDRIRFDIGHDTADNPYIAYPFKNDIIVENYATMLSELERGQGYVIVSPEMSDKSITDRTKVLDLPGDPLYIILVLVYKRSETRPEVLELVDRIQDTFDI